MVKKKWMRAGLSLIAALAVIAGVGLTIANASTSGAGHFVTALATTGDVTQTYTATGSITRKNTKEASFSVSGTVTSVKVAVGDSVEVGDTLASLEKGSFNLAVLKAEATVAQKESALYSARHPASSSSSSSSKSSSSTAAAGVSVDPKTLTAAQARVDTAVKAEADACAAVIAAGTSGTAASTDQVSACTTARDEVTAANTNLATTIQKLIEAGQAAAKKAASSSSSSSSSTSVSAAEVASAKADLLEAEQALESAQDDLANATLTAPISGTVGAVDLTEGSSSSGGTITIIGTGAAVVSFELPLNVRDEVKVGQAVSVTPAGASDALEGKVTSIATLETSGTSGDSPTYTAKVTVSDAKMRLASGAKASVSVQVNAVTGVVRVPASAVTPTGTGTATVAVLTDAKATSTTSTTVSTGAVGGGWVEITDGLTEGQLVVLADRSADIPANATRRRTTSSSSSSSASSSSTSTATATAAPQPSESATAKK